MSSNNGENPSLLDGIFNESASSGSDAEGEEESTADLILRAAKTIGESSGFLNKWIRDGDKQFYFSTEAGKLICYSSLGSYLEYLGDGRYVPYSRSAELAENVVQPKPVCEDSKESENKKCWITELPSALLQTIDRSSHDVTKKLKNDSGEPTVGPSLSFSDLLEAAEETIPGIAKFSQKWGIEEPSIRHLLKFDRILVSYILKHFSPIKAKSKNALQGMIESLMKYPQKWRIYSLREENIVDECSTRHVGESATLKICANEDAADTDPNVFLLDMHDEECIFEVFQVGNEYMLVNSGRPLLVDGMRVVLLDGPVPLVDGSVISVNPYHILLVEIGTLEYLVSRRNTPIS